MQVSDEASYVLCTGGSTEDAHSGGSSAELELRVLQDVLGMDHAMCTFKVVASLTAAQMRTARAR